MTKESDFHFSALRENPALRGNGRDFKGFRAERENSILPVAARV